MTLYEYTRINQNDFDCYDTEYDQAVCVCFIDEADEEDDYDKFCNEIIKKVNVIEQTSDCELICDWSKLIENNWDKFKAFTEKYWGLKYEDDDGEFVYQWIKEIHLYMAGYVSEDFYTTLVKFVDTLEVK